MFWTKLKPSLVVLALGLIGSGTFYLANSQKKNRDTISRVNLMAQEKHRVNFAGLVARIGPLTYRTDKVRESAMHADGQSIYVQTSNGISIHDLETGLRVCHFEGPSAPVSSSDSFAVSADGTLLAAIGRTRKAFLWDAKTGEKLRPLETKTLRNATLSRDGTMLAVEGDLLTAKGAQVLDVATGKRQFRFALEQEKISQILFTSDGKTLITVSRLGSSIYMTDVSSKEHGTNLNAADATGPLAALAPDGKTLAVSDSRKREGAPGDVRGLRFIDLAGGESRAIGAEEVPQARHSALVYAPDGRSVLLAGGGAGHVIDVASGKTALKIGCGITAKFHFTPDSGRLVLLDQKVIRVWDLKAGRELHPPAGPTESAERVALSPDGSVLASVTRSPKAPIYCWNANTGELLAALENDPTGLATDSKSVCFLPDGRLITSGRSGFLRVWDAATFKEVSRLDVPDQGHHSLSAASDGRTVTAHAFLRQPPLPVRRKEPGRQSARLFAWDLASGELLSKIEIPAAPDRDLPTLSPDGKRYIGLSGSRITLKETLTGKELIQLRPNPQPDVRNVVDPNFIEGPASFAADGQTAALVVSQLRELKGLTLNANYHLVVFDLASGKEQCRVPVDSPPSRSFALAPDGRRLAGIVGRRARIWETAKGKSVWEMPEVGVDVTAVAFSADGNRLVAALGDTTFAIWDVSSTNR
jgi:WD40 repeat protein